MGEGVSGVFLKCIYPGFSYSKFDCKLLAMHTAREDRRMYLWLPGSNRRWRRSNFASLYSVMLGFTRLVRLIHLASFDTGGEGVFTQQAHGEFIVSSETICPPITH